MAICPLLLLLKRAGCHHESPGIWQPAYHRADCKFYLGFNGECLGHLIVLLALCSQILELLKEDIKPRDIMTRAAFENAIVIVMALGGSTNAVLHLLAMARACAVPLSLDDFQAASDRTPFIADLKPSGKYVMEDVHKVRNMLHPRRWTLVLIS